MDVFFGKVKCAIHQKQINFVVNGDFELKGGTVKFPIFSKF
jgi:hypothetical protein